MRNFIEKHYRLPKIGDLLSGDPGWVCAKLSGFVNRDLNLIKIGAFPKDGVAELFRLLRLIMCGELFPPNFDTLRAAVAWRLLALRDVDAEATAGLVRMLYSEAERLDAQADPQNKPIQIYEKLLEKKFGQA